MTLKGQCQCHSDCDSLCVINEPRCHMLVVNSNRKPYMGSPMVLLQLTLVTLKGQCQCHSDFEAVYFVKEQG